MTEFPDIFMTIWFISLTGFIISTIVTLIIVWTTPFHAHFTTESNDGPQKIHQNMTPRIGGVAIFTSMVITGFLGGLSTNPIFMATIGATTLVFLGGLVEDLTGCVSPRVRLLLAISSGACFVYVSGFTITRVSFAPIDAMLMVPIIAAGFTIFTVSLFVNAINIIDGLNGLSIGTSVLIAGAIAGISGVVCDIQLMTISILFVAVILGVGLFNFPKGKIFVGDGGAYFMGAFIAFLAIMLPERNESISPFVSLLLVIYPSYEMVRSTIRRIIAPDTKALQPDQKHLHSLVYQCYEKQNKTALFNQNARAGLTMLIFPLFTSLWAYAHISNTEYAFIGVLVFIFGYEIATFRLVDLARKSDKDVVN